MCRFAKPSPSKGDVGSTPPSTANLVGGVAKFATTEDPKKGPIIKTINYDEVVEFINSYSPETRRWLYL